jgi:hypothetical protein
MKKYLTFICNTYYPLGGFSDFYKSFDTLEDFYNDIIILGLREDGSGVIQVKENFISTYELDCKFYDSDYFGKIQIVDRDTFEIIAIPKSWLKD